MPVIEIITAINAPMEMCFQLALSVDLHAISTKKTQEKIVGGVETGMLRLGDSVTFRARHFGVWQSLTSKVTELTPPHYFCDEMQQGAFKSMRHEHYFSRVGSMTTMRDVFIFRSPLGVLGRLVDSIVLKPYLTKFLKERCSVVKMYAETELGSAIVSQ